MGVLAFVSLHVYIQNCVTDLGSRANTQGLIDGGLAGLFWSYIWTFVGFGFVILSISEMASMAPISGGQYHWVSEFAPDSVQKQLSYLTGKLIRLCQFRHPFLVQNSSSPDLLFFISITLLNLSSS